MTIGIKELFIKLISSSTFHFQGVSWDCSSIAQVLNSMYKSKRAFHYDFKNCKFIVK